VMPEVGAELRRLGQRPQRLGLDLGAVGRGAREGDPQPARIGADLLGQRPRQRRRDVRITQPGARRGVEQRRRVAHGERHCVLGGRPAEAFAEVRRLRVPAACGLETDQPAARRRRSNAAEAIGRVRHRQHARADRRGRATAAAAGDARRIPRIPRGTVQLGLAGERQSELARVRAPEDHEPGALEPAHVLAVRRRRRRIGVVTAPARHRHAGDRGREVLHQIRHAAEGTVGQAGRDGLAAKVIELHRHRVDHRVARFDARDGRFQQLLRGHLAPRDQGRQAQRVVALILAESAHERLLCGRHSTVESILTRMGWHLPFDRAGRCLTRAQRALARRDFAAAETLLREAMSRDALSPHAHLYLAHALAEQERLSEAEAALDRAGALAPENFVFPLHLAIVRFDAGRGASAREALTRAAQLAPDNALVAGYSHLFAWDDGDRRGLEALRHSAHDLPESFRARLLLRLVATTRRTPGGDDALALIEATPDPPIVIPLPRALRDRWRRPRLARARGLVDSGRSEHAADYLAAQPDALTEPDARELLERARHGAVVSLTATIERAQPREQRPLLLRRYEYENDLGDRDAAYATLQAWLAPYADVTAPASEMPVVEAAARRAAELDGDE